MSDMVAPSNSVLKSCLSDVPTMLCCEHRPSLSTESYWLGLRERSNATHDWSEWYDGNPSQYRNWTTGEPDQGGLFAYCIIYTIDGFKDTSCFTSTYYTCKKPVGNLLLLLISCLNFN